LIVFPNPAASVLNFTFNNPEQPEAYLRFSTLTGKLVKQIRWEKEKQTMDVKVGNLRTGIYLYDLTMDRSKIYGKFIKE